MLLEFKIGNYSSFKDIQTLRMASVLPNEGGGTKYGQPTHMMFLYGPNASGKSNLIRSMREAIEFIKSERGVAVFKSGPFRGADYNPVREISYFEFVTTLTNPSNGDSVVFSYGFNIEWNNDKKKLIREWLYQNTAKEDICIYDVDWERPSQECGNGRLANQLNDIIESNINDEDEDDVNRIGYAKILNGLDKEIRDPPWYLMALFSAFSNNYFFKVGGDNYDNIPDVNLRFTDIKSEMGKYGLNLCLSNEDNDDYHQTVDLDQFFVDEISFENNESDTINSESNESEKKPHIILHDGHGNKRVDRELRFDNGFNQNDYKSTIWDESSGTFRLVYLLMQLIIAEKRCENSKETTLIVDEIECSVSTYRLIRILRKVKNNLFDNRMRGFQLIATTHETRLLDDEVLWDYVPTNRYADKDEDPGYFGNSISFVQKNNLNDGGSEICRMICFEQKEIKNGLGYLNHIYGYVPFFKNPSYRRRDEC